ncbi:MAG: hypothetical protein KIS92_22480, partial [Planctomycetota bacterium]|nr:hypothetical protein [Planctomycetota bacterium]
MGTPLVPAIDGPINAADSVDVIDFDGLPVDPQYDALGNDDNANAREVGLYWQNMLLKLRSGFTPIRNETGGTLTKGTLLTITGWSTTHSKFLVAKAKADDKTKEARLVLSADLGNAANGYGVGRGVVTNIDTSMVAAAGDKLYLSDTAGAYDAAAGTYTKVVGVVLTKHASTGSARFFPADTAWASDAGGGGGPPDPHAASHEAGGGDEIEIAQSQVTDLEGDLSTLSGAISTVASSVTTLDGEAEKTANKNASNGYAGLTAGKIDVAAVPAHASTHKTGGSDAIRLDELAAPTGSVSLNSQKITGLATPTASGDGVNKGYADGLITTIPGLTPLTDLAQDDPIRVYDTSASAEAKVAIAPMLGRRNVLLNGDFQVAQRGATQGVTQNGTCSAGSPVITGLASTANIRIGYNVISDRIPSGRTVVSIDSATQV